MDSTIKCDPSGVERGHFQIGEIAQMAGSALGHAETLYRTLSHNKQADFWWTKRVEAYDWFALVGVIANGVGSDANGDPISARNIFNWIRHTFLQPQGKRISLLFRERCLADL